jgi:hypothetical protein
MSNIVQKSAALAAAESVTDCLKNLLDGGKIRIYSGTPPVDPDHANSGNTLLCTLTLNNDGTTGLTWDTDGTNGILKKPTSAVWRGTPVVNGTASFWRWNKGSDDNSTTAGSNYRLQGSCGTDIGSSMFLATLGLTTSVDVNLAAMQIQTASA